MARFDGEGVVVGREACVDSGAPLPLDGYPRDAVAAEGAGPRYVAAIGQTVGRYGDRETGEEDLIVSFDRNGGDPRVGHGIERGGTTGSGW